MSLIRRKVVCKVYLLLFILLMASSISLAEPFPGKPPICPRWAFEPWVWEDNTNTRTSAENLVQNYQSRSIPVGAVMIDSPWETYCNTLVWDTSRYSNPQQMIDNFHAQGIKVIMWITGFVNNDSPDYSYVKSQGYAVNNGQDFTWWRGTGVHLDFTKAAAKSWWHTKMDNVLNMGIDGWKVDQGADYVSDPVTTSIGSITRLDFKKYYTADFYDYTVSKNPKGISCVRPYSHQGGEGSSISKCSIGWLGDHAGDFSGIASQKDDLYTSAQMGYGAMGVEVGGYQGALPTKNSLIRYAQFGAVTPLMENGGANGGEAQHLPWYWDTQTVDIYRYFATLHSELAPYNFSYSVESNLTGTTMVRNSDKTKAHHQLGNEIFVSVITSDTTSKTVYFPSGSKWIDYWNEGTVYDGGTSTNYNAPLDKYPVFIKAGAVIPMNVKTSVTGHGDATSTGKTTLVMYPYGQSGLTFHRPTGEGTDYSNVTIDLNESTGTIGITGSISQPYRFRVKSFAAPGSVSGADSWSYDATQKYIIIDKQGTSFQVTVNGLIGYSGILATPTPTPTPNPNVLITNLVVNDTAYAASWSIQSNIQSGNQQYGDRTFALASVTTSVTGSDWIRTANDSKTYTGDPLVTFKVTKDANVYVAHRDDITPKPSWLTGWTDTGEDITNNESPPKVFSLFRKSYAANATVSLGNNGNTSLGMYTIIVKAPAVTPTPTPTATPAPTPVKTEAENMTLSNYTVEDNTYASGGKCIKATGTGTAKMNFSGTSGTYSIKVTYFDENDGTASFNLYVNGVVVDSWTANQSLGSASPDNLTRTSRTKSGVTINNGNEIKIEGTQQNYEPARVDCIEIF
jgi:hypothetical protein